MLKVHGKQTFSQWLREQVNRDDPIGDLAKDSLRDKSSPKGDEKLEAWDIHLSAHQACQEAHEALRDAFREYRKKVK